jgi:hypothetical protein
MSASGKIQGVKVVRMGIYRQTLHFSPRGEIGKGLGIFEQFCERMMKDNRALTFEKFFQEYVLCPVCLVAKHSATQL